MKILLLSCLFVQIAYAKENIKMGTYWLSIAAGIGAGFELKKDGSADLIPQFDGENEDGSTNRNPKMKHIKATWKEVTDGIEITYLGQRDFLKFEQACTDEIEYPCFRFSKTMKGAEDQSLVKFEEPYINRKWKNPKALVQKQIENQKNEQKQSEQKKCKDNCSELAKNGKLKAGMDLDACIKAVCN